MSAKSTLERAKAGYYQWLSDHMPRPAFHTTFTDVDEPHRKPISVGGDTVVDQFLGLYPQFERYRDDLLGLPHPSRRASRSIVSYEFDADSWDQTLNAYADN